jgi:hypothetical protein
MHDVTKGVGWRIYVDHSDYENRSVDRRRRAVGQRRAGAGAFHITTDAVANPLNVVHLADHNVELDDRGRSDQHLRVAGDDYRLRAAGNRQQRRRWRRLRPAQRDEQELRIELVEPVLELLEPVLELLEPVLELLEPVLLVEFHEPFVVLERNVLDLGTGVSADGRIVERAARQSRRTSGGSDRDLRQPVCVFVHRYDLDGEPVGNRDVECITGSPGQHAAWAGDEYCGIEHGRRLDLQRDLGADGLGQLPAVNGMFPSVASSAALGD